MTKNRIRWLLFAFGVFATVAILAWTLLPRHRINKASFDQIKDGMTKAEVEAIFGVPPGIYCRRSVMADVFPPEEAGKEAILILPVHQFENFLKLLHGESHQFLCCWISSKGACVINFDADGIVENQRFHPVWEPPLWQRVKNWFAGLTR